jgi:type IV secretory pathway TraG/TraD family ATPase VirD4
MFNIIDIFFVFHHEKMTLMRGVLFTTLRGTQGWKSWFPTLDVSRVVKISYRKRLIRITDRHLPWMMTIDYYFPQQSHDIAPTITGKGLGFTVINTTKLNHEITARYASKEELLKDFDDITNKQKKLETYMEEFRQRVNNMK